MTTQQEFTTGQTIIQENSNGETAFVILQGKVEVMTEKDGENVHLGFLSKGEIFGEMSMIDDKPRSATVTAVEPTTVTSVHRDEFLDTLQKDPNTAVLVLKGIFNRLRETNIKVAQLQAEKLDVKEMVMESAIIPRTGTMMLKIEGLTPQAIASLPDAPYNIGKFPFRIGRKSGDPFSFNDLTITDQKPYQISRHHINIVQQGNLLGIEDRGSMLGAIVDGQRIGGSSSNPGPVFFNGVEGEFIIGTQNSDYRYKATIITM